MFFVFNKEKIISYVVAFSTVAILLTMSIIEGKNDTMETSTIYTDENVKTYINNEQNDTNKIDKKMNGLQ